MVNPHQRPPRNTTLGRLLAASSPLSTGSSTPAVDCPQAFVAEQLAIARSSLRLNPQDFPDFSQDTLSGLIPSETATLTPLSQLVRVLVTISQELSGVTQKLTALAEENDSLKEELQDLSSQIANLTLNPIPAPPPGLLCPRISDQGPVTSGDSPCTPSPASARAHASASAPSTPPPPPTRTGKERARAPPSPPPYPKEDTKVLIPYYETKLARAFGDQEYYEQLYRHSYKASEFRRGAYDLASFTPGHRHPDYTTSPSYAQAASGSGSGGKTKKAPKAPSP